MHVIDVILETGEERRKMVKAAIEKLGDSFFDRCQKAQSILIKVNLVHHEYQPASTHVDAVRGVIDAIRVRSRAAILVGDAGYHGTKAAFRHFGYERLPEEYDKVTLVDLNDDEWVDGYTVHADGTHNPIRRSKIAATADVKISLANLKMHHDTGVSIAIKNWTIGTWVVPPRVSPGGMVWARWPWLHAEGAWAHHASIMELYRQLPCDAAIVDGIMAMEGDGPTRGTTVPMGVVLAGLDAVAVDAVGATLMGVEPTDIGYLVMCGEQNLGVVDMGKINVPPMEMSSLRRELQRPPHFSEIITAWKK